ncbi:hypothetical protein [Adhaeretor mobilis]|uniref:Uncharacterized protein n=1 Tax=Adhaeretor mobilis TaxID=1930276 RepID=A0A517N018_9BACT|nr:hypothetical protein [Adhaeretor mobilis]QDT00465.1 hypothetical protein HG15A2_38030 [Adhaeretor mobilis]
MPMHKAILAIALLYLPCETLHAQQSGATGWRAPGSSSNATAAPQVRTARYDNGEADSPKTPGETPPAQAAPGNSLPAGATRAQVSKGTGALPNDHGQVWREYDITPYTMRVDATKHPEQTIVDWILRETGYEAWHSSPVGLLSADRQRLKIYHTPQMQATVADIVDRFVNKAAEQHGFGIRIITMKNPNWRARALPLMTPLPVQSPGVQGWIMAREDAALLLSELRRRTDYREHNPPHQMVFNGQSQVVSSIKPLSYTKGIIPTANVWPGYQPELATIDEGFNFEFSPLLSMDTATTDAVVKLKLTQVEKMLPVQLEAPSTVAPNQRTQVEVPQMTMVSLHERFRWPTNQVLLLSMGVVASPGPAKPNLIMDTLHLPKSPPRADALLMVESRGIVAVPGTAATGGGPAASTASRNTTFHGRY